MHYKIDVEGDGACGILYRAGSEFSRCDFIQRKKAENDSYFSNLPKKARTGIMLATIFGRQPGKSVTYPDAIRILVLGHTDDNMGISAETKDIPHRNIGNSHVSADYFKNTLEGETAKDAINGCFLKW